MTNVGLMVILIITLKVTVKIMEKMRMRMIMMENMIQKEFSIEIIHLKTYIIERWKEKESL